MVSLELRHLYTLALLLVYSFLVCHGFSTDPMFSCPNVIIHTIPTVSSLPFVVVLLPLYLTKRLLSTRLPPKTPPP